MTDHKEFTPTVLIVEDDPILRFLTTNMVEDAGFVAIEAADADEAVAILETRSDVALLLTDIDMAGSMDGLALARAVRNRWPPIKIIFVSARAQPLDCNMPVGSRFFGKPYDGDKIVSEIRSLIGA
jgi:CheY-like chemotaxis protein